MKILILGSEGFIGSHLVKHFRAKGVSVICADIVLKAEKDYIVINPEAPSFPSLFQNNLYDYCINATGAANVQFSFTYPYTDYFLNTANVYAILDALRVYNPGCAFINLSSAAVYGNPELLPIQESTKVQPTSPYGLHKYYSEQICNEFHRFFGLRTLSLRIFSAFGPGLKKQLFWDLSQKARNSSAPVNIYGTGKETRDFIYIDDLVEAVYCTITRANFSGNAVNIASGTSTSIQTVASLFLSAYNPALQPVFSGEIKEGDPLYWEVDISLLKSFGFTASTTIEQGIKQTVAWLKKQD